MPNHIPPNNTRPWHRSRNVITIAKDGCCLRSGRVAAMVEGARSGPGDDVTIAEGGRLRPGGVAVMVEGGRLRPRDVVAIAEVTC